MYNTTKYNKKISTETFQTQIIETSKPTILLFGAEWSGNSGIMNNMMERISEEFDPEIQFFKVDVEIQGEVTRFLGIDSVPTTVLFKEGEMVDFIKGFIPAKKMRERIKSIYLE